MKKLITLFLAALLVISVVSCGKNPSVSENKGESALVSDTDKEENLNEGTSSESGESTSAPTEMSTAIQITGDEQTGELPEIEGPDRFVELFLKNPIDAYYMDELEMAASVSSMLNITNNTMKYWESEVNSVYSKLMTLLGEDSEEFKKIKIEQNAWSNDLSVATEEIKEQVQNTTTDGSMVNIEISYRLMLLYRGRAVELLCAVYNVTGEVDIQLLTDAAG